ncbi:MAG: hypothetical protein ACRDQ4_19790 [Pseudonocardiaceae bacterium]
MAHDLPIAQDTPEPAQTPALAPAHLAPRFRQARRPEPTHGETGDDPMASGLAVFHPTIR